MFGMNVKQMAAEELAKISADVKNDERFQLIEKEIEKEIGVLHDFEARISPDELAAALNILFPKKFSSAEIKTIEASADKLIGMILNPMKYLDLLVDVLDGDDDDKKAAKKK